MHGNIAFIYSSICPWIQALALLQAALGGLPLEDWTLRGEQTSMLDVSARLLGCCAESLAVCGRGGGLGCAVSLRLQRSVRLKMWMDTKVCVGDGSRTTSEGLLARQPFQEKAV